MDTQHENTTASVINKISAERAFFNTLGKIYPPVNDVTRKKEIISGVKCYWMEPPGPVEDRIAIYLHGGAFALGSIESHGAMVSHLASKLSFRVVFIEYSLAPEKPFPSAMQDVLNVYVELLFKYPEAKISIIGDSAGGGLAVSFINKAIRENLILPHSIAVISPWLNLTCNTVSHETRKEIDPVLTRDRLLEYAGYYANNHWDEADPCRLSFSVFPPALIMVGSHEILFDDARIFADTIRRVQASTSFLEFKDQSHVWPLSNIESKASQDALSAIKAFMTRAPRS